MRRKTKVSFPVNIGASSLLVVFLVLCIATFAGLSLSAAKSDENAATQLAERRSAYYEASNRSESLVQLIADVAEEAYFATNGESADANRESAGVNGEFAGANPENTAVGNTDGSTGAVDVSGSGASWMKDAAATIEEKTLAMDSVEVFVEEEDGIPVISWEISSAQNQVLRVEVVLQEPDAGDNSALYRIRCWKTMPADEWEAGGTKTMLPVIPQ